METKKEIKKPHSFEVTNREKCTMTGIEKVISSSETSISLVSSCGGMDISGKGLKISKFDIESGDLSFEGEIDCIKYSAPKVSLLKRIFK